MRSPRYSNLLTDQRSTKDSKLADRGVYTLPYLNIENNITFADDIKALMDLGISLYCATELAVVDRNKVPAPGSYPHPVYFIISLFVSNFHRIFPYHSDELNLII